MDVQNYYAEAKATTRADNEHLHRVIRDLRMELQKMKKRSRREPPLLSKKTGTATAVPKVSETSGPKDIKKKKVIEIKTPLQSS